MPHLSGALVLRVCLPQCLGPPLVLLLCVCFSWYALSPWPRKGLREAEGPWKSRSARVLGRVYACVGGGGVCFILFRVFAFLSVNVLPSGYLFPVARAGPACHLGTDVSRSGCDRASRALGAELRGGGCGPESGLNVSGGPAGPWDWLSL